MPPRLTTGVGGPPRLLGRLLQGCNTPCICPPVRESGVSGGGGVKHPLRDKPNMALKGAKEKVVLLGGPKGPPKYGGPFGPPYCPKWHKLPRVNENWQLREEILAALAKDCLSVVWGREVLGRQWL